MKLNRLVFLVLCLFLAIISVISFFQGVEGFSIFVSSGVFAIISLIFALLGTFKWNDDARQALLVSSDNLKIFMKQFKLRFIGVLYLLWILLIVIANLGFIISEITNIPIPSYIIPIVKNIALLFIVVSLGVKFAGKKYSELSIGLFLFSIFEFVLIVFTYIVSKDLLLTNILYVLIAWYLFGLFNVYKKTEAPKEKPKKEKSKKIKKEKTKKISELTEEEMIEKENAKALEKFKKQKEAEKEL